MEFRRGMKSLFVLRLITSSPMQLTSIDDQRQTDNHNFSLLCDKRGAACSSLFAFLDGTRVRLRRDLFPFGKPFLPKFP